MGGKQEKKPCKYPLTLNKLFFYHFVERNFASLLTSRKKQEPFWKILRYLNFSNITPLIQSHDFLQNKYDEYKPPGENKELFYASRGGGYIRKIQVP